MSNSAVAPANPFSPEQAAWRALLARRTIILGEAVDARVANELIGQLLHLEAEDPVTPIRLLVNSPGGEVYGGMAIHDAMRGISAPVHTCCAGMAMSAAAVILAAGEAGHRSSLPHGRIMIHQPSGGFRGPSSDVQIQVREAAYIRDLLDGLLAQYSGQTQEQVNRDTERDRFMTPEEAVAYGLIDHVSPLPPAPGRP